MRTQHQSKRELDKIDRNILRILQADGRISFTELGEKVGLSTTRDRRSTWTDKNDRKRSHTVKLLVLSEKVSGSIVAADGETLVGSALG